MPVYENHLASEHGVVKTPKLLAMNKMLFLILTFIIKSIWSTSKFFKK